MRPRKTGLTAPSPLEEGAETCDSPGDSPASEQAQPPRGAHPLCPCTVPTSYRRPCVPTLDPIALSQTFLLVTLCPHVLQRNVIDHPPCGCSFMVSWLRGFMAHVQ